MIDSRPLNEKLIDLRYQADDYNDPHYAEINPEDFTAQEEEEGDNPTEGEPEPIQIVNTAEPILPEERTDSYEKEEAGKLQYINTLFIEGIQKEFPNAFIRRHLGRNNDPILLFTTEPKSTVDKSAVVIFTPAGILTIDNVRIGELLEQSNLGDIYRDILSDVDGKLNNTSKRSCNITINKAGVERTLSIDPYGIVNLEDDKQLLQEYKDRLTRLQRERSRLYNPDRTANNLLKQFSE